MVKNSHSYFFKLKKEYVEIARVWSSRQRWSATLEIPGLIPSRTEKFSYIVAVLGRQWHTTELNTCLGNLSIKNYSAFKL